VILDPDFLDHWKTRLLIDLLGGDECAPLYVIRIWGHCQSRRAVEFGIAPIALKAICRAPHDAVAFEAAMIEAGFVERDGPTLRVPKWAEHNPKLVANWRNGGAGGRPTKGNAKPNGNPTGTQQEPNENPTGTESEIGVTQREPVGEGRVGEGKKHPCASGDARRPKSATTSEGFERFWSAYPKKRSKGDAEKAWRTLKPDAALLGRILQAVEVAKTRDDWRKLDGQYVPFPATWLRAKGWDDDDRRAPSPQGEWWVRAGYGSRDVALAAGAKEVA
jgi:hypothetical protein